MELLMLLGLLALITLAVVGTLAYLRQRRDGTVLAVSIPARPLPGRERRNTGQRRAASAHK